MLGGLCIWSIVCDVSFALCLVCSVSVYFVCSVSCFLRVGPCVLHIASLWLCVWCVVRSSCLCALLFVVCGIVCVGSVLCVRS